jgi:Polysaccharide pyruvyl transferase
LGGSPYISDYYRKNARELLAATGGNTGNLAFQYAVASHLAGPVSIISFDTPVSEIRAAGNIIVLPLANQLGKHTDLGNLATKLEEIDLPIVGIGLGAQANSNNIDIELTSGTERWLRTIVRLSPSEQPNLGVRGRYTMAQLSRFNSSDAAVITGCPSNFINLGADIASRIDIGFRRHPKQIAVAAGIPYIPSLATIEQNLVSLVTETAGAYIVQHDLEMLQLARNEFDEMAPDILEICRKYMIPGANLEQFKTWCRRHAFAFYDAQSWMDFLRRFDFVIGTRVHGTMLAMQAGVAAACIAHDSRTLELCETMGIPVRHHREIGTLTRENLLDYFTFDKEHFIETRKILRGRYVELYRAADIEVSSLLTRPIHDLTG